MLTWSWEDWESVYWVRIHSGKILVKIDYICSDEVLQGKRWILLTLSFHFVKDLAPIEEFSFTIESVLEV